MHVPCPNLGILNRLQGGTRLINFTDSDFDLRQLTKL